MRLLYDGRERGRMYAAYALSSVMTPDADLLSMQAAGVVPALISLLNTSRVRLPTLVQQLSSWLSAASVDMLVKVHVGSFRRCKHATSIS